MPTAKATGNMAVRQVQIGPGVFVLDSTSAPQPFTCLVTTHVTHASSDAVTYRNTCHIGALPDTLEPDTRRALSDSDEQWEHKILDTTARDPDHGTESALQWEGAHKVVAFSFKELIVASARQRLTTIIAGNNDRGRSVTREQISERHAQFLGNWDLFTASQTLAA